MSENSDQADTSDDDDGENLQADTPSLMLEISEALARPEIGVFKVDDSEEDPECQSDNDTTENENSHENEETDDNPTAIEDEESDTDSIRTVEFSASESTEREEKTEDDEIIEIHADEDEVDHDNIGVDAAQDHNKGLENNETNDLIIDEGPTPNEGEEGDEGDDQDNDP